MIDYEKLKKFIQDELSRQKHKDCGEIGGNADCHRIGCVQTLLTFRDFLIELTTPKAKYKIGDDVWYIDLPVNEIHTGIILKVGCGEYSINGAENGTKDDFYEEELYPTKLALIEAQIQYWQSQKEHMNLCAPSKCQHESDGYFHNKEFIDSAHAYFDYKCIKCGEFYR